MRLKGCWMKFKAHDYQKTAINWILDKQSCGLLLDMGMGKTVSSLTALEIFKNDYFDLGKALVIAPKRVAEDTWPTESKQWQHLKNLKVIPVLGNPEQRRAALRRDGDLYIVTRDNVAWLVDHYGKDWPFKTVIIDELSSFKNHQSKRFKKLRTVRPLIDRVIGLTGTPSPNGYMDLWAQMYLLDQGERLGKFITHYRREYFIAIQKGQFTDYKLREDAKKKIDKAISDICISMKAKDYLNLKDPIQINRFVHLSDKDFRKYKKMEKEALLQFEESEVVALSAAAVSNKLLQLANGFIYDENKNIIDLHTYKLEILEEIIEESGDDNMLVFYNFQADKERIINKFKQARILDTDKDIADWNAGRIKMLLAHPASCGHGLNLQHGGSITVWYGLNWSLELYQQANARLHRQGQKQAVRIFHILAKDTIDEKVLEVLKGKNIRQEELLRQLKAEVR